MSDSDAILELRKQYMQCQDAGDAVGCTSFWDQDGLILPPNEPAIRGRESLQTWYAGVFQHVRLENQMEYDDIQVHDGWSYANGTYYPHY